MTTANHPPSHVVREVDASTVNRWLSAGEAVLIDVREADEHARERIAGSRPMPLTRFHPAALSSFSGTKVVVHCRTGRRSADACRMAAGSGLDLYNLTGGIESWKRQFPVETDTSVPRLSILRQVQITAGGIVLIGCALAWLVHPAFIGLSAFIGAGLVFAGSTGTCGMAALLSFMPWNRLPRTRD